MKKTLAGIATAAVLALTFGTATAASAATTATAPQAKCKIAASAAVAVDPADPNMMRAVGNWKNCNGRIAVVKVSMQWNGNDSLRTESQFRAKKNGAQTKGTATTPTNLQFDNNRAYAGCRYDYTAKVWTGTQTRLYYWAQVDAYDKAGNLILQAKSPQAFYPCN